MSNLSLEGSESVGEVCEVLSRDDSVGPLDLKSGSCKSY